MLAAIIMTAAVASSSTGGNYAGPGGVVRTGESYSSAYVRSVAGGTATTSLRVEAAADQTRRAIDQTAPLWPASATSEARAQAHAPARTEILRAGGSSPQAATDLFSPAPTAAAALSEALPGWEARVASAIRDFIRTILRFVQ